MSKIDLDAIIRSSKKGTVVIAESPAWGPVVSIDACKELMKEAIHQALVLAYENAHAYLDHDCETEDGSPSIIIDKDSILDVEKLII